MKQTTKEKVRARKMKCIRLKMEREATVCAIKASLVIITAFVSAFGMWLLGI